MFSILFIDTELCVFICVLHNHTCLSKYANAVASINDYYHYLGVTFFWMDNQGQMHKGLYYSSL